MENGNSFEPNRFEGDTVDGRNPASPGIYCTKPWKSWDKLPINWCRIPSFNSMFPGNSLRFASDASTFCQHKCTWAMKKNLVWLGYKGGAGETIFVLGYGLFLEFFAVSLRTGIIFRKGFCPRWFKLTFFIPIPKSSQRIDRSITLPTTTSLLSPNPSPSDCDSARRGKEYRDFDDWRDSRALDWGECSSSRWAPPVLNGVK